MQQNVRVYRRLATKPGSVTIALQNGHRMVKPIDKHMFVCYAKCSTQTDRQETAMKHSKVYDNSGNTYHYPSSVPVRMRGNTYIDADSLMLDFVTDYEWTMLGCIKRNSSNATLKMSLKELYYEVVDRLTVARPNYYKRMPKLGSFGMLVMAKLDK